MRKFVYRMLFASTVILLAFVFLVHLSTFLDLNPKTEMGQWWYFLQVGSLVCFLLPLILLSRNMYSNPYSDASGWWVLFAVSIVYALFNFIFTLMVLNKGGSPEFLEGTYALISHGKVIEFLNDAEFARHSIYEQRSYSGHWFLTYVLPVILVRSNKSRLNDNG